VYRLIVRCCRVVVVEQGGEVLLDWRVSGDEEPLKARVGVEYRSQLLGRGSLRQTGDLVGFEKDQVVDFWIQPRESLAENAGVAHAHLKLVEPR
jgi:hypothetical protein